MHMPVGIIDRRRMDGVAGTFVGHIATLKLHIDRHEPPPRNMPSRPHRVFAHDETGEIQLVYFRATGGWVEKLLPVGEERYVSGTIGFFSGMKQITHPDYVVEVDKFDIDAAGRAGLSADPGAELQGADQADPRRCSAPCPSCPNGSPPSALAQFRWPGFRDAMRAVHAPTEPADGELWAPAAHAPRL